MKKDNAGKGSASASHDLVPGRVALAEFLAGVLNRKADKKRAEKQPQNTIDDNTHEPR